MAEQGKIEEANKPKILGQLIIAIVANGEEQRIEVDNRNMNPYMLPMLLRQLAKNYEDSIMATRSLLE